MMRGASELRRPLKVNTCLKQSEAQVAQFPSGGAAVASTLLSCESFFIRADNEQRGRV